MRGAALPVSQVNPAQGAQCAGGESAPLEATFPGRLAV